MSTTVLGYGLQDAKDAAVTELLRPNSNIVGIGMGKKWKDGVEVDAVRVYVIAKLDADDLPAKSTVRREFLGVPTDVIPVGRFGRRVHAPKTPANTTPGPGSRIRVRTDAPNVNEGARGTLGAVVRDDCDNRYILGCNHLLAVNGRVPEKAPVVTAEIVGAEETIATRDAYVKLVHNGNPQERNVADCALALLPPQSTVGARFPDQFPVHSGDPVSSMAGMKVRKLGAITGVTCGTIVDTQVDLYMEYSFGTFRFENQIMIEGDVDLFATAGDSGSLVVDMHTNQPTAMIFAASGGFAVACPLEAALTQLAQRVDSHCLELEV